MKYTKLFEMISLILTLLSSITSKLNLDFKVYTKTKKLITKMSILSNKHPDLIKEHSINEIKGLKDHFAKEKDSLLRYYDIGKDSSNPKKEKVFLMSGEHPREMIAVEAMYYFIEDLITSPEKYKKILDNYLIRLVLIVNPYARLLVEKGEFCRRLNPREVDLNRNWDIYWGKNIQMGEENPGKKPFSEVETKFLKHLIEDLKPKAFLTFHSGVYGLYMPHAFKKKEGEVNGEKMKELLMEIKEKYCSTCQVGAPSKKIGYQSSGTCLDYTYEKLKIPYAFVWEIYTDEKKLPELEEYKKKHSKKAGSEGKTTARKARFMEIRHKSQMTTEEKMKLLNKRKFSNTENDFCLTLFNPLDKLEVKFLKLNWSKALKHFLERLIGQ